MLLKRAVLDRIVAGEIDLVFRRWKRPTVKTGGTLRTSVGLLEIVAVDRVSERSITTAEVGRAGYERRSDLLTDLRTREGDLYRIQLRPGGPDPRIELRERSDLSDAAFDELLERLARLDGAATRGPWTRTILHLLDEHPRVRAQDLADGLGLDKPTFKNDVRKLKNLGLTISHSPGYELSPRGRALLARLREAGEDQVR